MSCRIRLLCDFGGGGREEEAKRDSVVLFFLSAGGVLSRRRACRSLAGCCRRRRSAAPLSRAGALSLPTARRLRPCLPSKKRRRASEEKQSSDVRDAKASNQRTAALATFSPAWCPLVSNLFSPSRALCHPPVASFILVPPAWRLRHVVSLPSSRFLELESRRQRRARARDAAFRDSAQRPAREKAAVGGEEASPSSSGPFVISSLVSRSLRSLAHASPAPPPTPPPLYP